MNELITNMSDARTEITRPTHTTFPTVAITLRLLENEIHLPQQELLVRV